MLELKKINKSYRTGDFNQQALKDVSLEFRKNEFVAILGPSGSGKTTLLNIIGGLDKYDSGNLIINNKSTKNFKEKDWDAYRNNCIGFIFQSYNLISHMDILSNVEMGMTLSGKKSKERLKKAKEVLNIVGLKDHLHKKPNQLSGGQMQRVAIARALANNPDIILADEPTGALDSKTSIQIMDLIKEIAKDKLVIMVTHNPTLAKQYANRIIEMKDGEIISDSNPINKETEAKENFKIGKTSMNILTALHLSLNNIRTKKGRTFLTALASSIGIIGIALILSLSNGFDKQIDIFEKNTLSALPIIISKQSMNLDEESMQKMQEEITSTDSYPDTSYITFTDNDMDKYVHTNKITTDFIDYIEKISEEDVIGINYIRTVGMNLFQKVDGKVKQIQTTNLNISSIPHTLSENSKGVIDERFDILKGRKPTTKEELLLEVDSKNQVSKDFLDLLGLTNEEKIDFDEIIGKEITLVFNDDYYTQLGNYFVPNKDLEQLYTNDNNLKLKIVGIIRLKEDYPSIASNPGLYYTNELLDYVISQNSKSAIVKRQKEEDNNVLTGELFDLNSEEGKLAKETILEYLGNESVPYGIQIHPVDFESKERIVNYLDEYNQNKKEEEKIAYIDEADLMSSLSSNIMDAITIVLIAFSSISLVVSCIMIGIIMYISVLERTKEIGILRSLGARKKDISRVFNAETFIIGITSGLLGIIIARLLLFPVNSLLKNLTDLENIAILNPLHAIILVSISVFLTLIGGAIPANLASKKDPVIALRTE